MSTENFDDVNKLTTSKGQTIREENQKTKESFQELEQVAEQAISLIGKHFEDIISEGKATDDIIERLQSSFLSLSQNHLRNSMNAGIDALFPSFGGNDFGFGELFSSLSQNFLSGGISNNGVGSSFTEWGSNMLNNQFSLPISSSKNNASAPVNVTIMAQDVTSFQRSEQYISQMVARSVNRGQRNL